MAAWCSRATPGQNDTNAQSQELSVASGICANAVRLLELHGAMEAMGDLLEGLMRTVGVEIRMATEQQEHELHSVEANSVFGTDAKWQAPADMLVPQQQGQVPLVESVGVAAAVDVAARLLVDLKLAA